MLANIAAMPFDSEVADESPPRSLREDKKREARAHLAESARALFEERGYADTTIDDIAARARVGRRTFFRYFPTKEHVVFADNVHRLARFEAALSSPVGGETPFETVRRAALVVAKHYMSDRRAIVAQYHLVQAHPSLVARELELDSSWENAIFTTLLSGRRDKKSTRESRILAGALMGAIRATLRQWFETDGRSDLVKLGAGAFDLLACLDARSRGNT